MRFFQDGSADSWRTQKFSVIDVETTGLDLMNDQVISIGVVKIRDGRFKAEGNFYEEVSPTKSPSAQSIVIHGLRSSDLESAHPIEIVAPKLITFLEGSFLIAHAAWVERAFLEPKLKRHKYRFPKAVIDTAALARYAGVVESNDGHEPSLELLARKLNLPVYSPHHALGDAMTTAAVFLALVARIEKSLRKSENGFVTVQDLLEISRE